MFANVFLWIGIGIASGFMVYFIFPGQRKYLFGTITAGIVGAFVGGIFYSAFKIGSISFSFDPLSSVVATLGAVLLLYLIRILVRNEEGFKELKN